VTSHFTVFNPLAKYGIVSVRTFADTREFRDTGFCFQSKFTVAEPLEGIFLLIAADRGRGHYKLIVFDPPLHFHNCTDAEIDGAIQTKVVYRSYSAL